MNFELRGSTWHGRTTVASGQTRVIHLNGGPAASISVAVSAPGAAPAITVRMTNSPRSAVEAGTATWHPAYGLGADGVITSAAGAGITDTQAPLTAVEVSAVDCDAVVDIAERA